MAHLSMLTDPIQRVKLGLQNIRAHLESGARKEIAIETNYCMRAERALGAAYAHIVERRVDLILQSKIGGINLVSFVRQEMAWLEVKARTSSCELIWDGLTFLPSIDVEYKCLCCVFNGFYDDIFNVGACSEQWRLTLDGSQEDGSVLVCASVDHPKKTRVMELTRDGMDLDNQQSVCSAPAKIGYLADIGQEALAFAFAAMEDHGLWNGVHSDKP
jgi:hypothetical protein